MGFLGVALKPTPRGGLFMGSAVHCASVIAWTAAVLVVSLALAGLLEKAGANNPSDWGLHAYKLIPKLPVPGIGGLACQVFLGEAEASGFGGSSDP